MRRKSKLELLRMLFSDKNKLKKKLNSSRDKKLNSMRLLEKQANQILTRKSLLMNGSKLILMLTRRMRK
jgi:hypothetical protein